MCNHNYTTSMHMAVKLCRQSKAETYIYMAHYVGYWRSFECRSALCKPFIITIHQLVIHHFFPLLNWPAEGKNEEARKCPYWLQFQQHKSNNHLISHSLHQYKVERKFHLRLELLERLDSACC